VGGIRARHFLKVNDIPAARKGLGEELRDFPDNAQAVGLLRELGGEARTPPAPSREAAFLSPQLSPDFADRYLVRQGILDRLNQAIPLFRGTLLDVGWGQMPYREHILARNPNITRYVGLDFATGKYAARRAAGYHLGRPLHPPARCQRGLRHGHGSAGALLGYSPVLKEIRRVLVPGGSLIFTTPFLWPVHDAPHDQYRYTPYALQRLLTEAGFTDTCIEALGGWNASLAQMIGLWLRRALVDAESRARLTRDLHPFFTELVRTDVAPTDFSRNPMITGLSGTARAAGPDS